MGIKITGLRTYLPKKVVTNDFFKDFTGSVVGEDLEEMFGGAELRHHSNEKETALYMAIEAGRKAIKNAGVNKSEIDRPCMNECSRVAYEQRNTNISLSTDAQYRRKWATEEPLRIRN